MIEKLSEYKITSRDGSFINVECNTKIINTQVRKINELVYAVNELQKMCKSCDNHIGILAKQIAKLQHDNSEKANCQENVQKETFVSIDEALKMGKKVDPYAEQRKWVGKLCRFWDFVYDHYYFDTLKGITDKGLFIGHNGSWEHCEPVKPDEDIIYKGK